VISWSCARFADAAQQILTDIEAARRFIRSRDQGSDPMEAVIVATA
jgi:hypothetical protein